MKFTYIFLLVITEISVMYSHPTLFPGSDKVICVPPTSKNKGFFQNLESQAEFKFPTPISWHFHITYMLTNKEEVSKAIALREKAKAYFKDYLGPDCPNRYDNRELCMIIDHPLDITLEEGPFPIGEWSVWVPNSYLNLLMPWFAQNREGLSFLVHPNTGCPYEDHGEWAIWVGEKWNLDMSIFTQGEPSGEKGHHPGDFQNPTCLSEGYNCGSPDYKGVFLACCGGLECNCGEKCVCERNLGYLE
jgi:aromatic ring-cleaving dioxygenase